MAKRELKACQLVVDEASEAARLREQVQTNIVGGHGSLGGCTVHQRSKNYEMPVYEGTKKNEMMDKYRIERFSL